MSDAYDSLDDLEKQEDELILREFHSSSLSTAATSVASSPSKNQKEFDGLSVDSKISKLDSLVKKSQVYSNIIAENLLANLELKKLAKADLLFTKTASRLKAKSRSKSQSKSKQKTETSNIDVSHQPKLLSGATLKDYQLEGLDFLVSLYENGLNGILADEMGLGKTIQSIAFLTFLMEQGITGPFIVVVPLSTIGNWKNEFAKFAPEVLVVLYIGTKDARNGLRRKLLGASKLNVVLTSYEVSIRDHAFLRGINWKFLIVDEGHRLKNSKCLLIQKLKELNVSNRLLITGTPLQNNLNELWSLLNFILPDIFHDLELFQQWFNFDELTNLKKDTNNELENKLIELNIQKSLIENLHTILKPFILRRLKKDVLKGLPPKKEYIVYVSLTDEQRKLYQETLDGNLYDVLVREYFNDWVTQAMNLKLERVPEIIEEEAVIEEVVTSSRSRPRRGAVNALEMLMTGSRASASAPTAKSNPKRTSKKEITTTKKELDVVLLPFKLLKKEIELFVNEKLHPKKLGVKRRKINRRKTLAEEDSDEEFDHYRVDEDGDYDASVSNEELERRLTDFKYMANLSTAEGKQYFLQTLFQKVSKDLRNRSLQNMLMQLRNICNSPYVYYEPFPTTVSSQNSVEEPFMKILLEKSAKIQILSQLVDSLLPKGHKILVFSQFTKMLDILSDWFLHQNIGVCRLDGSSSQTERQQTIESFNLDDGPPVFLLSTRAGGLGINLTTADTVILFDSDWNPQIDLQAIDRAHRIGQTKPVKIYRLVVRDSIEEVLLLKSYSKIFLNKLIIKINEHKTQSITQLIETDAVGPLKESDDLVKNLKSLIELPKAFNHKFKNGVRGSRDALNTLTKDELKELMDRSEKCYADDGQRLRLPNISVFETINNME